MNRTAISTTDDIRRLLFDLGVQVRQADLHGLTRAAVMKLDNGYLVMVEQSLSFDAMLDALKHELRHIILGHLDDDRKTELEMEMEVRESDVIYMVDHGECHKKIYSVS